MTGLAMMLTGMKSVAAVVVPGTHGIALNPNLQREWRDAVIEALAKCFGGATALAGTGGYVRADNGKLELEPVQVVFAFTDADSIEQHRDEVMAVALNMGRDMAQESIGVVLGGEFMLIDVAKSSAVSAAA